MERDLDLIRLLLLELEGKQVDMSAYDAAQINYHKQLLLDAHLAEGSVSHRLGDPTGYVILKRLTSNGHDYLDAIRDDTLWAKVKRELTKRGGDLTFTAIKAIAIQVVTGQIQI